MDLFVGSEDPESTAKLNSTGEDSTGGDSTGGDSTGGDSTGGESTVYLPYRFAMLTLAEIAVLNNNPCIFLIYTGEDEDG
jgi:hypothetical protein